MEDDLQNLQAVHAISNDSAGSPTPATQTAIVHIDTHPDPDAQKPFILWGDIQ
jgi:hypothetical protein